MTEYTTKDSGERARFESGMQRDTEAGKARFDLLMAEGVPYEAQFLTRCAELLGRGAEKYDARNWERANSEAEMARMKSSAFRHFMQWLAGETDEDHAAAVVFNLYAHETTKHKVEQSAHRERPLTPEERDAIIEAAYERPLTSEECDAVTQAAYVKWGDVSKRTKAAFLAAIERENPPV